MTNQGCENPKPCCHNESRAYESDTILQENGAQLISDNLCEDQDIFPGVSSFRRRFMSNFILPYENINSFRHKFAPSSEILSKKLVDFMAIAETKPGAHFYVEDFTLHRQDFIALSGGLIIYIRSDLPHRRLKYAEVNCYGIESLCIEVTIGNTKTAITL